LIRLDVAGPLGLFDFRRMNDGEAGIAFEVVEIEG
jgi:hypothetical protein